MTRQRARLGHLVRQAFQPLIRQRFGALSERRAVCILLATNLVQRRRPAGSWWIMRIDGSRDVRLGKWTPVWTRVVSEPNAIRVVYSYEYRLVRVAGLVIGFAVVVEFALAAARMNASDVLNWIVPVCASVLLVAFTVLRQDDPSGKTLLVVSDTEDPPCDAATAEGPLCITAEDVLTVRVRQTHASWGGQTVPLAAVELNTRVREIPFIVLESRFRKKAVSIASRVAERWRVPLHVDF